MISIHALREEGDDDSAHLVVDALLFLSTPSARRATRIPGQERVGPRNFYPRPPRGGRRAAASSLARLMDDFYPRPPRGGRPRRLVPSEAKIQFLSTPSARRATDAVLPLPTLDELFLSTPSARRATVQDIETGEVIQISIHALREEGDRCSTSTRCSTNANFYPRPPRGGRLRILLNSALISLFLSTPSARRATGYEDE